MRFRGLISILASILLPVTAVAQFNNSGGGPFNFPGSRITGVTDGSSAAAGKVGELIGVGGIAANATITVTIASPAVVSDAGACAANVFQNCVSPGSVINFTTTGALPTGITAGTNYFVLSTGFVAGTSYRISLTQGGAAINTSGSQSGVQTRVNTAIATGAGAAFSGAAVLLSAGDWSCGGNSRFVTTGTTTGLASWIGTTTNSATGFLMSTDSNIPFNVTGTYNVQNGQAQISLSSPTNYFLVGQLTFSTGTGAFSGIIQCRRMR